MRISRSIGTSAAVAAVLTHGMVFSGVNLNEPLPVSTYQGFFRHILLATERLWSYAHGWQPMSHTHDFGRFYAPFVQLMLEADGDWPASHHPVGLHCACARIHITVG